MDNLDFVYIIKPGESGIELRYSLRSIAKHFPNNKVWIVGYKPYYVENVNYLPVEQTGSKWSNSTNNVIQACKCEDISDDFILMNDDFYCISPTMTLEEIIDSNLGTIEDIIERYKKLRGAWVEGFKHINKLLHDLNIEEPLYSYEAHTPLRINKKKFLEVMSFPEVQEFMKTDNVLHKRTLYKNYDRPDKSITLETDTKVTLKKDNSKELIKTCGWLSTADNVVGNKKFYNLNILLRSNFPDACVYESEYYITKGKLIPEKVVPSFTQTSRINKSKKYF